MEHRREIVFALETKVSRLAEEHVKSLEALRSAQCNWIDTAFTSIKDAIRRNEFRADILDAFFTTFPRCASTRDAEQPLKLEHVEMSYFTSSEETRALTENNLSKNEATVAKSKRKGRNGTASSASSMKTAEEQQCARQISSDHKKLCADDVSGLKVIDLRKELSLRGLKTSGLKAVLAQRLADAIMAESTTYSGDLQNTQTEMLLLDATSDRQSEVRTCNQILASSECQQKRKQSSPPFQTTKRAKISVFEENESQRPVNSSLCIEVLSETNTPSNDNAPENIQHESISQSPRATDEITQKMENTDEIQSAVCSENAENPDVHFQNLHHAKSESSDQQLLWKQQSEGEAILSGHHGALPVKDLDGRRSSRAIQVEQEAQKMRLLAREQAVKRIAEKERERLQVVTVSSPEQSPQKLCQDKIVPSADDQGLEEPDTHKELASAVHKIKTSVTDPQISQLVSCGDLAEVQMENERNKEIGRVDASQRSAKPTNLVSGIHSFTSLRANTPTPTATTSSTRQVAPVSSLKLAEAAKRAQEKREEERKKRKEELLKKYEEERKVEERKRQDAIAAQREARKKEETLNHERLRLKREKEMMEKKRKELDTMQKKPNQKAVLQLQSNPKSPVAAPKANLGTGHERPPLKELNSDPSPQGDETGNPLKKPTEELREFKAGTIVRGDENNYEMSDRGESSSSEEESEDESSKKPKKKLPLWALAPQLFASLEAQYQIDPDTVFHEVHSCDLEAIFQAPKKKYTRRGSSGNWIPDRLTSREKVQYKRDMGFVQ